MAENLEVESSKLQTVSNNKPIVTPLSFLAENDEGVVYDVIAGQGLTRRLSELGFIKGTPIKVIKTGFGNSILVEIKGSRLALSRGIANKIFISKLNGEHDG